MLKPLKYDIVIIALMCLCLAACDMDDERDLCCKRVVMEYHYMSGGKDAFKQNIRSLRHFLFNGAEQFIREIPCGENLQLQTLDSLKTGNYAMVTVGNAADATRLETPAKDEPLAGFMLHVEGTDGRNADPLYYGICRFTLKKEDANREQRFLTQMANIHCRLQVTVKWQNLPPAMTTATVYRMALENCAENHELDGKRAYSLGEKQFPHSTSWNRVHRLECALKGLLLKEEFISLRYTNSNLPILHLFCRKEKEDYEELTPPLDLGRAFKIWGYKPENAERQEYKIIVTIYLDGHVGVKVEAEAGVEDWIEGGSFG